ncbi:MAG: hypothetical protein WD768_07265 [Phycisphaeraceae bacterium]
MRLLTAILLGMLCVTSAHAAAPKLDWLYPAGAGRDTTAAVTVSDTSAWPVQVWIDDEQGITIEATKDKGKLSVKVAADAKPGVRWVRLYNGEGASPLRPFIIGVLPEVDEKEPNNDEPQAIREGVVVNGRLEKRNDIDVYRLPLKRGQTLIADMTANATLGSPMDGVIQLCDGDGFVLLQNDDARGLDPRIVFTVPRDGDYLIRTFAFPAAPNSSIAFAGDPAYVYRLMVTTGPFADHALPMAVKRGESGEITVHGWNLPAEGLRVPVHAEGAAESIAVFHGQLRNVITLPVLDTLVTLAANDASQGKPQNVTLPAVISGRLESAGSASAFTFAAKKGQTIRMHVESQAIGFPLDPVVRVTDASGKQLAESSDRRNDRDGKLEFKPAADGEVVVSLRDLHDRGGLRFVYRLVLRAADPDFAITLDKDTFIATPGKAMDLAVKIDRRDGFDGDITLRVEGLPAKADVPAIISSAKGATAKTVTLKLALDEGPWSGPIRIIGEAEGTGGSGRRVATFAVPATGASQSDVWLTVNKAAKPASN